MKIPCPRCPICGGLPDQALLMALGNPEQVFCGTADCPATCWDSTKSRDENLDNATYHWMSDTIPTSFERP